MNAEGDIFNLSVWVITIVILLAIIVPQIFRILKEYERGVVFRLGKLLRAKGPGLVILIPFIDKMVRVDLRVVTSNVPQQDIITNDNVPVSVDAITYFRVVDPEAAIINVENYLQATSLFAQTTLRSVLGQVELDELLAERDRINQSIQEILDRQTDPWGVKVTSVEVKDVILPENMRRAMAKQAETERERRAKIINARGEFQAAAKLVEAGQMISKQPIALQLRYLQTMSEIGTQNNTIALLPLPMELFRSFTGGVSAFDTGEPAPDPKDINVEDIEDLDSDESKDEDTGEENSSGPDNSSSEEDDSSDKES